MQESSRISLELSSSKAAQLVGFESRNIRLLEIACEVRVIIHDTDLSLPMNHSSTLLHESSTLRPDKIKIDLVPIGYEDFSNKPWAKKVHSYIKSATRGGFLAWFKTCEFEDAENPLRSRVLGAIASVMEKHNVNIVLSRSVFDWKEKPSLGPEPSLCLCILPSSSKNATVVAKKSAAATAEASVQAIAPEDALTAAISEMTAIMQNDWYHTAAADDEDDDDKIEEHVGIPQTIAQKREERRKSTKQRNKIKEMLKATQGVPTRKWE